MKPCVCCGGELNHPGWGPAGFGVCGRCGSGFLPETARPYDAGYFDGSGGVDYAASKRQFQWINHRRLDWLTPLAPRPGRLLEVGCALGFFLEAAEERGWTGFGVEISPFAAAKARERHGERVIEGVLEAAPAAWKDLDLACGFHVLEHVPDPAAMVSDLAGRLKPGGLIAWEVPDFGSRAARTGRESWQYFLPGEHLNYFSLEGLKRLHKAAGMELVVSHPTSFTRLLGGVDRAGMKRFKEFVLRRLRWLGWIKALVLRLKGATGAHDCVFVVFKKREGL